MALKLAVGFGQGVARSFLVVISITTPSAGKASFYGGPCGNLPFYPTTALITIIIALLQTAGTHLFPCAMKSLPGSLRLFAFASSTFLNLLTLGMFEYLLSIRNVSLLFHSGLISWRLFFGRHNLVTHSLPDGSVHFEIRWWGVCISAMKVYYSRPTTQVRRSMVAWIKKCWNQNHEFRTLKFSFLYLLSQKHVVFCKPVS